MRSGLRERFGSGGIQIDNPHFQSHPFGSQNWTWRKLSISFLVNRHTMAIEPESNPVQRGLSAFLDRLLNEGVAIVSDQPGTPAEDVMSENGEKKLAEAIREAEKLIHDLERRIESLIHQDDELHSADAISRALKSGEITREHLRASHLGD